MQLAANAARRGRLWRTRFLLVWALAVQCGYLAWAIHDYVHQLHASAPQDNAYSSIYYMLLGADHAHVAVGILLVVWLLWKLAARPDDVPAQRDPGRRLLLARRQRPDPDRARGPPERHAVSEAHDSRRAIGRFSAPPARSSCSGSASSSRRSRGPASTSSATASARRGARSPGTTWGIGYDVWQLAILAAAGVLVLVSEAAAVTVFLATRETNYGDGPPGRRTLGRRSPVQPPPLLRHRRDGGERPLPRGRSSWTASAPSSTRYARSPDHRRPRRGAAARRRLRRGTRRHAEGAARRLRLPPLRRVLPQLPRRERGGADEPPRLSRPGRAQGAGGIGRRCTASARSRPTSTSAPATCRSGTSACSRAGSRVLLGDHQIKALVAYVATFGGPPIPTPKPAARQPLAGPVALHRALRRLPPGRRPGRLRHGRGAAGARPGDAAPGRRGGADRAVRDAEVLAARDQRPAARLDRPLRRVHARRRPARAAGGSASSARCRRAS